MSKLTKPIATGLFRDIAEAFELFVTGIQAIVHHFDGGALWLLSFWGANPTIKIVDQLDALVNIRYPGITHVS